MRWFGSLVRPPSLRRAFVTTGALLGAAVLSTIVLVLAAARALDRSTSPLVDATEVRHAAVNASVLEAQARHLPREALVHAESEIEAAQAAVRKELTELIGGIRAARLDALPEAEALVPLWDQRCLLARDVIRMTSSEGATAARSPELARRTLELDSAVQGWNDRMQAIVVALDRSARRSISTLEYATLGTSALALGLLAVGAVFSRREILRPLQRLAAAEASVARGRLDVRMDTRGVAEIRELALGFNEMVASLRARATEVRAQQELLTRRERALDRRNRELAAANAELDAFAYAASHDLRAPLRGIENMARFLSEDVGAALDDEARDKLERIRRAARRLHQLIDSLLDVARAGRELGPRESVSLGDAAALALESLDAQVRDSNAVVEVARDLPSVPGDRTRLVQVLQNLLSNAIKYASGPGRTPRVSVGGRLEDAGEVVAFWVEDNGIGIPEDQHRRIFQLFRRLHRESDYEGTGVGLSIVQRAVQAHGGSIQVESAPGRGARFTVRLPALAAGAGGAAADARPREATAA